MSENTPLCGARVIETPPTPQEIHDALPCKVAPMPRSRKYKYQGVFSVGSLLVDCRDLPDLWEAFSLVGSDNLAPILKVCETSIKRTSHKCLHSIYSLVMSQFTQKTFASYVSMSNLQRIFALVAQTESEVWVDYPYVDCFLKNWLDAFCVLQKISTLVEENATIMALRDYNTIVEEIQKLPFWLQVLVEDIVLVRCGPLRDITTRVNIANFNWFMNQLKMATSSGLLHELFCSPSVMGKCAALYKLLEIHGQLWKSMDLSLLEDIIPTLFTILSWVFEKSQALGKSIKSNYYWVKAKFRCASGEDDMYPNLKTDLPQTEDKVVAPESEEVNDFEESYVTFDSFYNRNILGFSEPEVASYNNNCMFVAAGQAWSMDPSELRSRAYDRAVMDQQKMEINLLQKNGYPKEAADAVLNELIQNLDQGNLIGTEALPYICRAANRPIAIEFENKVTKQVFYMIDESTDYSTEVRVIRNDDKHWVTVNSTTKDAPVVNIYSQSSSVKLVFETEVLEETANLTEEVLKEKPAKAEEAEEIIADLESTEMGKGFLSWFKNMVGDVLQFFKSNPIIGGAVAFCYSLMSAIGLSVGTFSNKLDKRCFWQKVSGCSRDFFYLSRGKDAIAKVFGDFGAIIRDMMGIDDSPITTQFKLDLVAMTEKAEEMNALCQTNPESIVNDPNKFVEFKASVERVRKQYRDLISIDPTINHSVLVPLWTRLNAAYQHLLSHYNKLLNGNEHRQRPYCLWMWGRTGIGKSELIQKIVYDYSEKTGTCWKTFTISTGPEYLNGFAQEKIIIIDDFDSFTSVEGCLDALLIMNMVTCAAYNPNIANLEDKAMQAKPALIIVCANFPTVKLNCGINDFAAFERRRDLLLHVRWPEHEACAEDADCDHVKKFQKNVIDGVKTYDHLTFTKQSSLVISHKKYNGSKESFPRRKAGCPQVSTNGYDIKQMSLAEIVDDMVHKIDYYRRSFEITKHMMDEQRERLLKKKMAKPEATIPMSDSDKIVYWEGMPNISLSGPPGTGKTFTMKCAMSKLKPVTYKFIATCADFDSAASVNFHYEGIKYLFFDDTSSYINSPNLEKWIQIWKERYDAHKPDITLWCAAINTEILKEKISDEKYDMFIRRSNQIEFSFKRRKYAYCPTWMFYSAKDLEKKPKDQAHATFVHIFDKTRNVSYLQDVLANFLVNYRIDKGDLEYQVELPVYNQLAIDARSYVGMSTKEFVKMINTPGTATSAIGVLTSAKFHSERFESYDIGKRIWKTFTTMINSTGTWFESMDQFVLSGSNSNFFDNFNDGVFVMSFLDKSYCLVPHNGRVHAGVYEPLDAKADMEKIAGSLIKTVNSFDFLSVTHSKLPPWFVVSALITEQVIKILAGGLVINHTIQFNNAAFKALKTKAEVDKIAEKYTDDAYEEVHKVFKSRVEEKSTAPSEIPKPPVPTELPETFTEKVKPKNVRTRGLKKVKNIVFARKQGLDIKHDFLTNKNGIPDAIYTAVSESAERTAGQDKVVLQEMASDYQFFDSMKLAIGNMVDIRTLSGQHLVYGLMIHGKVGTTVAHAFVSLSVKEVLVHDIGGNSFTIKEIRRDNSCDILDFEIENGRQFSDIRNHMTPDKLLNLNNRLGCLVNVNFTERMPFVSMRFYRLKSSTTISYDSNFKVSGVVSYVGGISGFSTELPPQTIKGDCGSVMFLCDPKHCQKIVGLHVASSTTEGFYRPLNAIDYATKASQESNFSFVGAVKEFGSTAHPCDMDGNPLVARCLSRPHLPNKSKIYRSPFSYGVCEYEPSILDMNDPRWIPGRDMVVEEAMKWLEPPKKEFSPERENMIRQRMFEIGDWIGQKINALGIQTHILTKTTALNSVKGFSHSQPIPVGTSAGYPFSVICNNGKRELISVLPDGSRRFSNDSKVPLLHNAIDRIVRHARQGLQSDCAFIVFGKDELLKPGKNTRTIAAAPLQLVIPLRMYFHTISAAIAEVWNMIPVKVGITPTDLDWHNLACYFLNVSDLGFSIDQKGFDFNVPKIVGASVIEALLAIAQVTNPDLTVEDIEVMRGLHLNVSLFNIIIKGLVYKSTTGIASGHPGTAIENSIISFFFLFDAFCELSPDWYSKTVEHFVECVAAGIYGDDAQCTATRETLEFFNQVTVTKYLTETYGLVITNADKTSIVRPFYPLSEMQFISRGFKLWDGFYVGPLEMKRLLKPLNYCNGRTSHHWYLEKDKVTDDLQIACDAARSALDEMFFHGKKAYEDLRRHILRIMPRLGNVEAYYPPWDSKFESFFRLNETKNKGLMVTTISIDRAIMPDLQRHKGWIGYHNRRCLNFGPGYYWDEKSKKMNQQRPIPVFLLNVLRKVNDAFGTEFNEVLANFYHPGGEVPFHKDDEKMVDLEEGVACVTIVGDGEIEWIDDKNTRITKLSLCPGFCYYMSGDYVKKYRHSRHSHEKYTMSLTFRKITTS